MKKVELKIHPGKVYEVHEKEFKDLSSLGMVTRIIETEEVKAEPRVESLPVSVIETPVDSSEEETPLTPNSEISTTRKKRTYKRKTSPTSEEESE